MMSTSMYIHRIASAKQEVGTVHQPDGRSKDYLLLTFTDDHGDEFALTVFFNEDKVEKLS